MPDFCWKSTPSIWIKPLNGLMAIIKCCNHLLFIILGEWQKCWDMEHYLVLLMCCVHTLCPSHISSHIETTWTKYMYIQNQKVLALIRSDLWTWTSPSAEFCLPAATRNHQSFGFLEENMYFVWSKRAWKKRLWKKYPPDSFEKSSSSMICPAFARITPNLKFMDPSCFSNQRMSFWTFGFTISRGTFSILSMYPKFVKSWNMYKILIYCKFWFFYSHF